MLKYILLLLLMLSLAFVGCAPDASDSAATNDTATEHEDHEDEEHADEEHADEDHADEEHGDEDHEGSHREHDAHEHGAAELTIAWIDNQLAIDLDTPAYNVLGFEYAPSSDDEIAFADESVAFLEAGTFLAFSPAAECGLVSADVDTEFSKEDEEHGDEDHADEDHADEETHSDIEAAYSVECQQPDELTTLDLAGLFSEFPNFEDLQVQWVTDTQQSADTLTSDNTALSFE